MMHISLILYYSVGRYIVNESSRLEFDEHNIVSVSENSVKEKKNKNNKPSTVCGVILLYAAVDPMSLET